jgi:hypothetical protein
MKRSLLAGAGALCVLAVGSAQATVVYSTNFESDQSANFTTVITSADTEANFNYDYSTWAPTSPTAGVTSITAAPSGAGTKGLKMRSNFDITSSNEAVTAYINSSASLTNWILTFDAYQLWNGPEGAVGTGTTTAFLIGNATTAVPLYGGAGSLTGWFLFMTSEGGQGASGDARYYSASGGAPTQNNTLPDWRINGGTVLPINMPGAPGEWDAVFPGGINQNIPGTPGRQWVTWEIKADSGTGQVRVRVKPDGGVFTQIALWTQATGQTTGLGFWDPNTGSIADPPDDNFVVIDNLTLETFTSDVKDWSLY